MTWASTPSRIPNSPLIRMVCPPLIISRGISSPEDSRGSVVSVMDPVIPGSANRWYWPCAIFTR